MCMGVKSITRRTPTTMAVERSPPQVRTTPIASMTTPWNTFYTLSKCNESIPATQYSTDDEKDEAQVENHQHALLIQALNNAPIEMSRLQVKGNNITFKVNLGGFLQEAMTIARSPTRTPKSQRTVRRTARDDANTRNETTNPLRHHHISKSRDCN